MTETEDDRCEPAPEGASQGVMSEPEIYVSLREPKWAQAVVELEALCQAAALAASQVHGQPQSQELSIAFVDDTEIKTLNASYRGKDKATNVLSFPADAYNPAMGDIVIALETCQVEADEKQISLRDHTAHLLVHGYLHLCGYDHENDVDAKIMEALEIKALKQLDIDNPYEDENGE